MTDYLKDKRVKVGVGDQQSEEKEIKKGVLQGAVLSPTLFNVMLHDIPQTNGVEVLT